VALIDGLAAEWRTLGRSGPALHALEEVARRDDELAKLVFGDGSGPAPCPTPCDVLDHMRCASGRVQREAAAHVVRVLLREAGRDPFVCRMLVQALVPGLVRVAGRLRWGRGGDWQDGEEFFGELLSTTWQVITDWAGQDRPYAVLDLLSAIRCRLRRQLLRAKDRAEQVTALEPSDLAGRPGRTETDLETLARLLVELHRDGMPTDHVQVVYAQHVLGYSMRELAALTGRDRRSVYTRRDRGTDRVCA
jgi:DNA-directed RNA polymerase specialized sigma24 family protein